MTVFLVSTVLMPRDGSYTRRSLSKEEFRDLVREAYDADNLIYQIRLPVITEHIQKLTGISVEVSGETIDLVDSGQMLICQCLTGVDSTEDETFRPTDEELEYFVIRYRSEVTRRSVERIRDLAEIEKQRIRNEIISELLIILQEAEQPIERGLIRERLNQWIEKRLPVGEKFYTIDELIVNCFPLIGPRWRHNRRTQGDFGRKLHWLANALLQRFTPWEIVRCGHIRDKLQLVVRQ